MVIKILIERAKLKNQYQTHNWIDRSLDDEIFNKTWLRIFRECDGIR